MCEHRTSGPAEPERDLVRIGDTYGELLEAVRGSGFPICWDTGHYLLAVERKGQAADPPEEFVRRVRHVHLHEVVEGRDHQPVRADSERLAGYLRRLWADGPDKSITLEYEPQGVEQGGGFRAVIERSLTILNRWRRAFEAAPQKRSGSEAG